MSSWKFGFPQISMMFDFEIGSVEIEKKKKANSQAYYVLKCMLVWQFPSSVASLIILILDSSVIGYWVKPFGLRVKDGFEWSFVFSFSRRRETTV